MCLFIVVKRCIFIRIIKVKSTFKTTNNSKNETNNGRYFSQKEYKIDLLSEAVK